MKKWLTSIGVVLALALAGFGYYWQSQFFVVSTSPKNNDQKAASSGSVTITFNHALDPINAQRFAITPAVLGKVKVDGSKLIFIPSANFKLGTNYTVTVKTPLSASGKVGKDVHIEFRATYVDFAKLSNEDQQRDINGSGGPETTHKILQYIPHSTLDYRIDYRTGTDDSIILEITLLATFNRPDQRSLYEQELRQYKKEALDYLRSKGEDPGKYQIEYDPPEAKSL